MSIIHKLRLKDIILDLSKRSDIYEWMKVCRNYEWDPNKNSNEFKEQIVPIELRKHWRIQTLEDSMESEFDRKFKLDDITNIELNMVICYKNNNSEMEAFVKMLQPYIKSGDIYHNEEDDDQKVNYTSEFDVDIIDDEEYVYFNYYNKDTFTPEELLKLELEAYTNPEDYEDKLNNLDYYR